MLARFLHLRPWQQFLLGQKGVQNHHQGQVPSGPVVPSGRPPWTSQHFDTSNNSKEDRNENGKQFRFLVHDCSILLPMKRDGNIFRDWATVMALGCHMVSHGDYANKLLEQFKKPLASSILRTFFTVEPVNLDKVQHDQSKYVSICQLEIDEVPSLLSAPQLRSGTIDLQPEKFKIHSEKRQEITQKKAKVNAPNLKDIQKELEETQRLMSTKYEAILGLDMIRSGKDIRRGVALLKSAAASNDASAIHNLGVLYEKGIGVETNLKKAAKLYKKAAKLGNPDSIYNLAIFYHKGIGGIKKDRLTSESLFKLAQKIEANIKVKEDQEECRLCQKQGWFSSSAKEQDEELPKVTSNGESCYQLARAHHFGLSGLPVDKLYALSLYDFSAQCGHSKARLAFQLLLHELKAKGKNQQHEKLMTISKSQPDFLSQSGDLREISRKNSISLNSLQ